MLILVGPSASGKTEIAKLLDVKYHLTKIVTHTTREKRINEKDDIDYHFVSKDTFLNLKNNNEFVETTLYNNNYYGTSKKEIADNKCVVLDPQGAYSFYELNDPRIYIVFLNCKESVRKFRMLYRQDDLEKIEKRLLVDRDTFDIKKQHYANIIIDTSDDSPLELTTKIYNLYISHLNSLK